MLADAGLQTYPVPKFWGGENRWASYFWGRKGEPYLGAALAILLRKGFRTGFSNERHVLVVPNLPSKL
jgi:hypothetical protein